MWFFECDGNGDSVEAFRDVTYLIGARQNAAVREHDGDQVAQLLSELSTRGIVIRNSLFEIW